MTKALVINRALMQTHPREIEKKCFLYVCMYVCVRVYFYTHFSSLQETWREVFNKGM